MSLPQAKKDISDRPRAGTVTEPIDRQKLQTDVDRKLQLYGVFAAMRQSRLPTNDQIDALLSRFSRDGLSSADALSPEGQTLVQDTHDLVETLRALVQQKNSGEVLQNFVWRTRDITLDSAKEDPSKVLPVDRERARSDGQQAVRHLRTLLSLVFTNAEVRKLVSDFGVVGRDLLARGAEKAAEMARPDADALARVDEPGPEYTFYTEGGQKPGTDETPVPEAQVLGTNARVTHDPRSEDAVAGSVIKQGNEEKPADQALGEAQQRALQFKREAQAEKERQKADIRERAEVGEPVEDEADVKAHENRIQDKFNGMKKSLLGRVPDEHWDRANEHANRVKNFLSDEYFPQERRDQVIFRLKKVIYECQSHEDYQGSVQWLLNFLEEYASHGHTIAGHGKDSHQQIAADPSLQQSLGEIRTLLERFANGRSLSTTGDTMRALYDDAQRDERLRHWFRDVDEYVREVLLQPGYVLDEQSSERAREFRENGRQFHDGKYKPHFDNLFNTVQDWFKAWADDSLNQRVASNFSQLAKDLLFDAEGNLKFKPALWADVRRKIIPGVIEQLGYIPIPRIEYTDEQTDLVLENLALSGKNIFPNLITMDIHNYAKLSGYDNIKDETHHELKLTLSQIQADMRDVAFYFRRKTGTPKLTDSGLADVLLGGEGLTITVHLVSADRDRSSVFKVKDVHTSVHTLKFSVRDSKHDTLYKLLGPLATGLVKKQLQKAVGTAVRTALEYVDAQLVEVREGMAEAKASEDKSRRDVLREQLVQRKYEAEREKGRAERSPAQFKLVTHPEEKLMPGAGHPDGWVNRTQERAETAKRGAEWRSEAYNIL